MKKYIVLTAGLLSVIILLNCVIFFISYFKKPKLISHPITLNSNLIDNDYNNFLAGGELCQKDGNIYYFDKNIASPTLTKITKLGYTTLYKFTTDVSGNKIYQNNGKLYYEDGLTLGLFNFKTNKFDKTISFEQNQYANQMCIDKGDYYYLLTNNDNQFEISISSCNLIFSNGNQSSVIENNVYNLYVTNQKVYYTKIQNSKLVFYEYDKLSKDKKALLSIDYYKNTPIFKMIVDNGTLFYDYDDESGNSCLFGYKIGSNEKPIPIYIDKEDNFSYYNVCNGKVYIQTKDGIMLIDTILNTNKMILSNYENLYCIYIIDDKYVYFTSDQGLCRILQTGSTIEVVRS